MSPLGWLLGLVLPACGAPGAQGLPVPPRMDIAHITRPATPNTALAAPDGFIPRPDIVTRPYPVPPARLYAAIMATARAQPRTYPAAEYPDAFEAHFVVRSAVFNFPDLVTAQVQPAGAGQSTI